MFPPNFVRRSLIDLLARAAFEFAQRPVTAAVSDFVAGDPWVTVKEGFALIQAVSALVLGDKLGEALTSIGGNVRGSSSSESEVSAWLPLQRIRAF